MAAEHYFWKILIFVSLVSVALAENAKINVREEQKKVLDQILNPQKYDAQMRPPGINGTDEPTRVQVNLFVRSISKIDDVNMEYSVQLTFRQKWLDERLKFDFKDGQIQYVTLANAHHVWTPDLFFSNEKEGHFHNIMAPNTFIRIFPDGGVLYSTRVSLTLSCPMNLKLYPMDAQVCSIRMTSYGYNEKDLIFEWKEYDPVQVIKNLHLPRFTLEKYMTDYCTSKTLTGTYSCLKVDFLFQREVSHYLTHVYIPYCMLVIVSWLSFWLDQSAVTARVLFGVAILLTTTSMTNSINNSLPPVSYTKAIDVWTGFCLTFIFAALLEFVLVNYTSRLDMQKTNMKNKVQVLEQDTTTDAPESDNSTDEMPDSTKRWKRCLNKLIRFPTSRSERIDAISRLIFPLLFIVFNLIYWAAYLQADDDDLMTPAFGAISRQNVVYYETSDFSYFKNFKKYVKSLLF